MADAVEVKAGVGNRRCGRPGDGTPSRQRRHCREHGLRYGFAVGTGRCGIGEEGLEVVLDEREECGGGVAPAVDGGGAAGCGKGPRGVAQAVRVGVGLGMPTTVRRQARRRNGRVGQRRGLGRGRSGTLLQSGLTLTYRRRCEIYY
jgi:hypothetical protein